MNDKLSALLAEPEAKLIGPKTAQALRDWLAAWPEPDLPTPERIESMISRLAIATANSKMGRAEAGEMHDLYWRALRDVPLADLAAGFDDLIKSATFLPKPAEVRAAAMKYTVRREYRRLRASYLVARHEREWVPTVAPEDRVTPAEIDELRRVLADAVQRQAGEAA